MRITFWGVRGSIAVPGPDTIEVGGNTSCVEVRCGEKLLIMDGGTGIRLLGRDLIKQMPIEAYIFFSHVHWDHIQGFPFFTPAFVPGNKFHLYGGNNVTHTLEDTLAGQMDFPSFPVHLTDMGARMTFHDLAEGERVTIGEGDDQVTVQNTRGNHPNGVFAYRITHKDRTMVYCTDTEHYAVIDEKLRSLAQDADVLIYDTMYLPEEYAGEKGMSRTGWGHSTYEEGAKLAKAANVKKLVLFHHDPEHSDQDIRDKERRSQEIFPDSVAAREGLVIDL